MAKMACLNCKELKDTKEFGADGHKKIPSRYCLECTIEINRLRSLKLKKCNLCEVIKPFSDFKSNKRTKDGCSGRCKECCNKASKVFRDENPDIIKRQNHEKYTKHGEKYKTKNRTQRKESPYLNVNALKSRAKQKGWDFDLIKEELLIPPICPVFGIPLIKTGGQATDNSPSADRLDNTKSYVKSNVKIISFRANRLKSDGTIKEHELVRQYQINCLISPDELYYEI